MEWVNETRRGELVSTTCRVGRFKLVVHRYVGYPPDMWLASCYGIFDKSPLASKDLEEAKGQALAMVQVELEIALKAIQ